MDKKDKIKVVIVDDFQLVTDGVSEMLRYEELIEVVGKASDEEQLFSLLKHKDIDLLLMDIEMPGSKVLGIELARSVKQRYPATKILMLTQHNKMGMLNNALKQGVDGYLLKDNANKRYLVDAVKRAAIDNSLVIDPNIKRQDLTPPAILTKREKEVVCFLVKDKTPKEIGELLNIKYDTVREYLANIRIKLNVSNSVGIVNYAHRNNICDHE